MGITDRLRNALVPAADRSGTRVRAVWNGVVLAESDETVVVEGNHYFPESAVDRGRLEPVARTTVCGWKGTASYFDVVVDAERNPSAAWTYRTPKEAADHVRGHIAFWRGVRIEPAA